MTSLIDQLPRLSEYDVADLPEGGLDPLGLGAVADRMAESYAPAVRARMAQPRFLTLAAVGALTCAHLRDVEPVDGVTTFDLAFEWVVLEALVRHAPQVRLPGWRKVSTAVRKGDRVTAASYLSGPRVFGFTGVYRPLAISAGVLDAAGGAGPVADDLLRAWEASSRGRLHGFVDAVPATRGRDLRDKLAGAVRDSLRTGSCAAPKGGWTRELAPLITPDGARAAERRVLRKVVEGQPDGLRHELVGLLERASADSTMPEHQIAARLQGASRALKARLTAAARYEECATVLDNSFRRLLRHGAAGGGLVRRTEVDSLDILTAVAPRVGRSVERAVGSAEKVHETIADDVAEVLKPFRSVTTAAALFDGLMDRHEAVQEAKGKRSWLDPVRQDWLVRDPYQEQSPADDDTRWVHPMRLTTLTRFLEATR